MKLAGAAVLLALGAGLGTYLGLGGAGSTTPKIHRSAILDAAVDRGLIHGYRVVSFHNDGSGGGSWEYSADDDAIHLSHRRRTRMAYSENLFVTAETSRTADGRSIADIAQHRFPSAKIHFYAVTTLGG